jgi:predicted nucleotidyltransferase
MVTNLVNIDRSQLDQICRQYHVRRLSVFGSVVRGEATPKSDIDMLVDYEPGYTPTFFLMTDLAEALRPLFGGRDVDLVLPESLHWFIRDDVLSSSQVVYER